MIQTWWLCCNWEQYIQIRSTNTYIRCHFLQLWSNMCNQPTARMCDEGYSSCPVCLCVSVFAILPSRAFGHSMRGISGHSAESHALLRRGFGTSVPFILVWVVTSTRLRCAQGITETYKFGEMARYRLDKYLANLKFGNSNDQIESYGVIMRAG